MGPVEFEPPPPPLATADLVTNPRLAGGRRSAELPRIEMRDN